MPIWQPKLEGKVGDPRTTTLVETVLAHHIDRFGHAATMAATAPASWALIGENTDNVGGVVLASLADWAVVVAISPNNDSTIVVELNRADQFESESYTTTVDNIGLLASAQSDQERLASSHPVDIATRLGGVVWTMIHRQMLTRETRGLNITIFSTIPPGIGLGEKAACDVATALALCNEDAEEAPVRARLAEICSQAAEAFGESAPARARYTVALRGEHSKFSVIDYADGSVTQAPHLMTKSSGLSVLSVQAPSTITPTQDNSQHQLFIEEATHAFSVESLRLLPDASSRVLDWLKAVIEVTDRTDLPTIKDAQKLLEFWELETQRAQKLASALRSRRHADAIDILNLSQLQSAEVFSISSAESALSQLCLARGAVAARSSYDGDSSGIVIFVETKKLANFCADFDADGFFIVPLGHGDIARKIVIV